MKDYLKRVRWDRKKCIITGVVTAVILMMASVCIIVVQLQNRKNKNTNNMDNIIAETVSLNTVQETTAEETTQEQTEETEEETEEETYEVVEESEVEDFFENEISTEDEEALALPARKLTSEFIPYDGKYREITCYGDSMMAGAGSATPGIVNGKDIYGWTSPHTLEKLTNIPTHNLGVSGENSYDIIINSNCKYYIIVGDTDDPGTSLADDNQGEFNEDGSYVGIGDTAWEAALREAYGQHFFNTRTYMIQNGLTDCGLSTTTDDLENYKKGNISKQLRYDWTHFNSYGYYAKGIGIYKKGVELGYWS